LQVSTEAILPKKLTQIYHNYLKTPHFKRFFSSFFINNVVLPARQEWPSESGLLLKATSSAVMKSNHRLNGRMAVAGLLVRLWQILLTIRWDY